MNLSKRKLKYLFDSLIVMLNVSNSYSIIPYFLFFQYYRGVNSIIILIINLLYFSFRFNGKKKLGLKNILFVLFVTINVLNYIFSLFTGTFGVGTVPFLFVNITFFILLINLFHDYIKSYEFDKSLWLVLRGYIWFSLLGLFSVIFMFFLINVLGISPFINDVGSRMDLFTSNLNNPNTNYYFPYKISIFLQSPDIRIPFFQKDGIITGMFHEPHTSTFLLTPSLFILLYFLKSKIKKIFILFLFVLFFLTQASTTNILSLLVILFIFNINKYRNNILFISFLIIIFCFLFFMINPDLYGFILYKLDSGSASYSLTTLKYPFLPKSLFGSNFYDLSYIETFWESADKTKDIGYILFLFNFIFLLILIIKIFIINKNLKKRSLLAIVPLYFLLHSTKIAMYSFTLSYFILIIFIIQILSNYNEKYTK